MLKFIDRDMELDFLNSEYNRSQSSLIVLYGRRRIGKTALIAEFMRNKEGLYFLATEESELQNCIAFKDMVADYIGSELLKNAFTDDWDLIFKTLLESKTMKKKLLVIDEFQYIGKSNPAFPSVFQRIWDTMLKDANIMVILSGSLISMIESQILNYNSPLYGRRTGQIKLKQIQFSYYQEFFSGKSRRELIEYYSITGGVPKYIELFYDSGDIYSAIRKNILNKASFLYEEPIYLLQHEVSEIGSYFSIIKAIAMGNHKLSNIAGSLGLKQTGLTRYLKTLIDLDILEREVPITEDKPEKSKKGLYRINDNFINFWFKFVYPYLSYIERGNIEIVESKIRTNLIGNHISYIYEDICIEEMWRLSANEKWDFHFQKVGRWWNNNTEIDIVALDNQGNNIVFGECKYWANKIGVDVFNSLEEKAKKVDWKQNERHEWYVLFNISGFTDEVIELADKRKDILLCE